MSHGTSRSRTDGTSDTSGTSTSETEGTTRGTSQSRTAGTSETIQKRALVTPDEIGQLFARIDDRAHHAYPGLALVVISGARPVALRRVNYFEDFQFMGLFDPNPDHPFVGPKTICVTGDKCGVPAWLFDPNKSKLRLAGWFQGPGTMVTGGAPVGVFEKGEGQRGACERVANLLAARAGRFKALTSDFSEGPLYQIEYYEDGTPEVDPFAELRKYSDALNEVKAGLIKKRADLIKSLNKIGWVLGGAILAGFKLADWVWGDTVAGLIALLGIGVLLAVIVPKVKEKRECDAVLKKSFPD